MKLSKIYIGIEDVFQKKNRCFWRRKTISQVGEEELEQDLRVWWKWESEYFKERSWQKQPPEVFYKKTCYHKLRNIDRKTTVLEYLFSKLAALKALIKKRLQQSYFPVDIVKF